MADAGCQCVYVVDSAGALVLEGVRDRVAALVAELGDDAQVGFHGHENLGLGVANSVEAVRAGAKQIDGSCRRFGAGAGNAPVEALIGVFDKIGVKTGIDFFDIADAAEDVVRPAMPAECLLDRNALIMGYSGVYSSFLKHAVRQAERYGVPARRCCTAPVSANSSVARKTSSSTSRWKSSASKRAAPRSGADRRSGDDAQVRKGAASNLACMTRHPRQRPSSPRTVRPACRRPAQCHRRGGDCAAGGQRGHASATPRGPIDRLRTWTATPT